MESIQNLTKIDFPSWVIVGFMILSGFTAMYEIIGKFSDIIGKPVGWIKKRKEDHELLKNTIQTLSSLKEKQENDVKQSIRHDKTIKDNLKIVSEKVDAIAETLSKMQKADNVTEMKKLKEKLVAYYNKYKNSDGWTSMDKEVFWDLFEDYEKRGGDGFIHSKVEPVMCELKVIDKE